MSKFSETFSQIPFMAKHKQNSQKFMRYLKLAIVGFATFIILGIIGAVLLIIYLINLLMAAPKPEFPTRALNNLQLEELLNQHTQEIQQLETEYNQLLETVNQFHNLEEPAE